VDPLRYPARVELGESIRDWHNTKTSGRLLVKWNRFDIGYGENDLIDIELWGYYEDDSGPHWDFLHVYTIFSLKF
jgi:hypothetical protein